MQDLQNRLAALLPEARVGTIERIEPITVGLSGAAVYAVAASRGAFVLRVQPGADAATFAHRLLVVRRAAEVGVTPAVVHVDEPARATVTVRVQGPPLPAALSDPAQRNRALASLVDQLRAVHAIDPAGVNESDPLGHARAAWQPQHTRAGFPSWAQSLPATFDAIAGVLAGDARRTVNHNDVNPMNVIWDGSTAWLLDWDVAGIGHPHYDLATLAMFLRLDDAVAFELGARHDGAPLDDRQRASFRAQRQLVALLCGLTFLSLSENLGARSAPSLQDAPSLGVFYTAMRAGQLDLLRPRPHFVRSRTAGRGPVARGGRTCALAVPVQVAQEVGDLGKALAQEGPRRGRHRAIIHRCPHAADPGVAHGRVDRHLGVTHAQPRMPVVPHIVVGAAEPADQERTEPVAVAAADLALLVQLVQRRERRLGLLHHVVETLDQRDHLLASADLVVGVGHAWRRLEVYRTRGGAHIHAASAASAGSPA